MLHVNFAANMLASTETLRYCCCSAADASPDPVVNIHVHYSQIDGNWTMTNMATRYCMQCIAILRQLLARSVSEQLTEIGVLGFATGLGEQQPPQQRNSCILCLEHHLQTAAAMLCFTARLLPPAVCDKV